MKKLFALVIIMNLFLSGYSQANRMAGASCTCPGGWGSCSAVCVFSDCCVCFNPATSEGGCACYWGVGSCKTGPSGVARSESNHVSDDAKTAFSFERFDELIKYLVSVKIDVAGLTRGYQPIQSKYLNQKGKVSVLNSEFNNLVDVYTAFINGLTADQKNLLKNYIDNKEKTN